MAGIMGGAPNPGAMMANPGAYYGGAGSPIGQYAPGRAPNANMQAAISNVQGMMQHSGGTSPIGASPHVGSFIPNPMPTPGGGNPVGMQPGMAGAGRTINGFQPPPGSNLGNATPMPGGGLPGGQLVYPGGMPPIAGPPPPAGGNPTQQALQALQNNMGR